MNVQRLLERLIDWRLRKHRAASPLPDLPEVRAMERSAYLDGLLFGRDGRAAEAARLKSAAKAAVAEHYRPAVTAANGWYITRERLIEAITCMSLADVPKWGANSPAEWVGQLVDGITGQLGETAAPRLVISLKEELTPEKRDELVALMREAMNNPRYEFLSRDIP